MICTSVIIVGKMAEQSWKIFNFLHFCWPSTHGPAISEAFKIKSWNFHRLQRVKRYIDNLHFDNHSWKNDWAELKMIIFLYFFDHPHQVSPFLNHLWWKAKIFTGYVYRVNNLMICTLTIIVGKIIEQSWKISNFLHFWWPSTHGLAISNLFNKMKNWNFHRLQRARWYIDNLYFGNHSWKKNGWAELEMIRFVVFFLTIHTRFHHFWTIQDGKLKCSQNM